MEQINLSKLIRETRLDGTTPESWLRWALIKGIVNSGLNKSLPPATVGNDTILDVDFKINGVEVEFSQILKSIILEFNRDVKKTAKQFLNSEVTKATDRLHEIASEFATRLSRVGDEFEAEISKHGNFPWKDS